jgi:hypothetical protein
MSHDVVLNLNYNLGMRQHSVHMYHHKCMGVLGTQREKQLIAALLWPSKTTKTIIWTLWCLEHVPLK